MELSLTLNKESNPWGAGAGGGVRPRRKDSRARVLLAHHYSRNGSCRETGARCWLLTDQKTNLSVATRSSVGWGWGAGASVENRLQRREGSRTESAYLSLASGFRISEGTSWPPAPNSRTLEGRSVSGHRSYPASVRLCKGEAGSSDRVPQPQMLERSLSRLRGECTNETRGPDRGSVGTGRARQPDRYHLGEEPGQHLAEVGIRGAAPHARAGCAGEAS